MHVTGLEVQRGQVGQSIEGEYLRHWEGAVENEDNNEVREQHATDMMLLTNRRDQSRQGMMTHEGVYADSKELGNFFKVGHDGMASAFSFGQSNRGEDKHDAEREPAHHCGQDLNVFRFGHVEEDERPQQQEECSLWERRMNKDSRLLVSSAFPDLDSLARLDN